MAAINANRNHYVIDYMYCFLGITSSEATSLHTFGQGDKGTAGILTHIQLSHYKITIYVRIYYFLCLTNLATFCRSNL